MQRLKKQTLSAEAKLHTILQWLEEAEAIVIGGASGMSAACGYDYYSHRSPFFYLRNIKPVWKAARIKRRCFWGSASGG
jgi:hypothetical protein